MKKVKKGYDPLVNHNAFEKKPSGDRILINMPISLHRCIDEIRYKEKTTLRDYVRKAIAPYIGNPEIYQAPSDELHLCSFAAPITVKTSVILTQDEFSTLRAINHYWKVSYSYFIIDFLAHYMVNEYGNKYPDAPGMKELRETIRKYDHNAIEQ